MGREARVNKDKPRDSFLRRFLPDGTERVSLTVDQIRAAVECGDITWDDVPWTPFTAVAISDDELNQLDPPKAVLVNSRYSVTVYECGTGVFGPMVHLSIKTHDRSPRHDWRDLQRIKNEICGAEAEAVELYPAESRLVDGANQYHLYVFRDYRFPFGFKDRLVTDGSWRNAKQRPWRPEDRPADCLNDQQFARHAERAIAARKGLRLTNHDQQDTNSEGTA